MNLNTQKLSKGTVIFKQGDDAVCMYAIEEGSVGIYVNFGEENEAQLTVLEAGRVFGEMGLIDNLPRSATAVVAAEGTVLSAVTPEDFDEYVRENPDKALQIMRGMSARIRTLTKDYIDACGAISELTQNAAPESKSGLKSRFKRFLEDYDKIHAELAKRPELYYDPRGMHPLW